jgi:hypothetical protein
MSLTLPTLLLNQFTSSLIQNFNVPSSTCVIPFYFDHPQRALCFHTEIPVVFFLFQTHQNSTAPLRAPHPAIYIFFGVPQSTPFECVSLVLGRIFLLCLASYVVWPVLMPISLPRLCLLRISTTPCKTDHPRPPLRRIAPLHCNFTIIRHPANLAISTCGWLRHMSFLLN